MLILLRRPAKNHAYDEMRDRIAERTKKETARKRKLEEDAYYMYRVTGKR